MDFQILKMESTKPENTVLAVGWEGEGWRCGGLWPSSSNDEGNDELRVLAGADEEHELCSMGRRGAAWQPWRRGTLGGVAH
jgi:hypothetical protein